jgi:cob(I)alamin adenosyltransferase
VRKDDERVAAYGEVDELNCALGAAVAALGADANWLYAHLRPIQQELFVIGSTLAGFEAKIDPSSIARLEQQIDEMTAELPKMEKFIVPGGSRPGAVLHLARAVCRRAERAAVKLSRREKLDPAVVVYLNRLSDYLFTAARWANQRAGQPETEWAGLRGQ